MSKFSYSSLLKLSEIGLFILMHMSGSMCIPQEQGLVNGSQSLSNKLQEQSPLAVGMLTRKIMHVPMTGLAIMHKRTWPQFCKRSKRELETLEIQSPLIGT